MASNLSSNVASTTNLENDPNQEQTRANTAVFFNRKSLDNRKRKPKPIVYQIHLSCKCRESNITYQAEKPARPIDLDDKENVAPSDAECIKHFEKGAWASLIQRHPQDNNSTTRHTTYMISGNEESGSNIQIRMTGLKEVLKWITADVDSSNWPYVEAVLVSSDVFLVNLLREWLPRWARNDFSVNKSQEAKRPNYELLSEIAAISTKIKLSVEWQSDNSHEMITISNKVDELLKEAEEQEKIKLNSNRLINNQATNN